VFPNSDDLEASMLQVFGHEARTGDVAGDFGAPVFPVRNGQWSIAGRTPVPEATVHEDGELWDVKGEVRTARQRRIMHSPATYSLSYKRQPEPQLGRPVASGTHAAHPLAALCLGQTVHRGNL
jgi:hypothetical protein